MRLVMRSKEVKVASVKRHQQYQNTELFFERFYGERKKLVQMCRKLGQLSYDQMESL